ncbi:hypothetical protein ANO14919_132990 [Xylariales sp. No.14919]|nr:hypothetical protein ANO14919_132990 [Xylariales sp. No.14919]
MTALTKVIPALPVSTANNVGDKSKRLEAYAVDPGADLSRYSQGGCYRTCTTVILRIYLVKNKDVGVI